MVGRCPADRDAALHRGAGGATWHDIATAPGTSPEQAELRYNPDSPVADSRWPYDYD